MERWFTGPQASDGFKIALECVTAETAAVAYIRDETASGTPQARLRQIDGGLAEAWTTDALRDLLDRVLRREQVRDTVGDPQADEFVSAWLEGFLRGRGDRFSSEFGWEGVRAARDRCKLYREGAQLEHYQISPF
jgi:hypothetical protein